MRGTLATLFLAAAVAALLLSHWPQAAMAASPTVTLTVTVVGAGRVQPAGGVYKQGAYITLTAYPDAGWRFDHWEGGVTGTKNPISFKIRSNTTVTAVFVVTGSPTPTPTRTPTRTVTPTPSWTPTRTVTPTPSWTPTPAATATPSNGRREIVGYFPSWGIYQRQYYVKNIATSGSASLLTVINYAFIGIGTDLKCKLIDPWADYQIAFTASQSVDGVADLASQPLKGNFNQLRKLKAMYPGLKVVASIGGWNDSSRFSDAALPANRAAFVSSCIDMFIRGQFAPGVTDATIFDGIDVDWEYPGRCGATCNYRAEDRQNFTALLAELRGQLDAVRPGLLLTIAAPSSEYYYSQIELDRIPTYLNWVNLMTYDYHGSWEPTGPTNHHSPLYTSPADPSDGWSSDRTVRGYLAGGVPADKLTLGLPFFGRGWTGVSAGSNHGLYQPASGVAPGTYEAGVEDFKALEARGYPGYWDSQAQAYWIYNGSQFWTYDNAASASNKMGYVKAMGLRGAMFWDLAGDASGTLIHAIAAGLN